MLKNLIFVIIIFVLATALPLSTDIFTINLSTPIVENTEPTEPLPIQLSEAKLNDLKGTVLTIHLTMDHTEELLKHYTLVLKDSLNTVYEKTLLDLIANQTAFSTSRGYQIDLSQWLSELPNAVYQLELNSKNLQLYGVKPSSLTDPTVTKLEYTFKYKGGGNQLPQGLTAYTLYFPNTEYSLTVPITRFVKTPENRWLALYSNLLKGPKSGMGLYLAENVVPPASNFLITNKIAKIYWSSSQLDPFKDHLEMARLSVSQTLLNLGYITAVDFIVDNTISSTFGGIDWTKTFPQESTLKAFVIYQNQSDYGFLTPIKLSSTSNTIEEQARSIWDALQFKTISRSNGLLQLIPPTLSLNTVSLNDGVLSLDFGSDFNTLYANNSDAKRAMIDSILYSFSSLPGVQSIRITSDGEIPSAFEGWDFNQQLKPNMYINIEP